MQTLTYVYADQTAVLGPLATYAEPHAYDLCQVHGERLSAPRGWEVLRLATDLDPRGPSGDDLLALADAVRDAARPRTTAHADAPPGHDGPGQSPRPGHPGERGPYRGHLRVLTTD
ncbi:hypothetical protein GCM10023340_27560 [Nocardioides marinquilinus]|uniref:DUF3499 domain-containing protein n=1 Tax=Nocardioides marinquilinus TaxID=1210400 RepID=A0ABP9PQA6_9ACTN